MIPNNNNDVEDKLKDFENKIYERLGNGSWAQPTIEKKPQSSSSCLANCFFTLQDFFYPSQRENREVINDNSLNGWLNDIFNDSGKIKGTFINGTTQKDLSLRSRAEIAAEMIANKGKAALQMCLRLTIPRNNPMAMHGLHAVCCIRSKGSHNEWVMYDPNDSIHPSVEISEKTFTDFITRSNELCGAKICPLIMSAYIITTP